MAVAHVRNHTAGNSTTAATTIAATVVTADVAAGNLLVAWVVFDNTGTSTPTVSSVSKPGGDGGTWTKLTSFDSPTATAAAGLRGELWGIVTTTAWPVSTAVTATLSASVDDRTILLAEFSGASLTVRHAASASAAAVTTQSVAISTGLASGDLVVGASGQEFGGMTWTADTDTINGSWSSAYTTASGTGTSADMSSILQYKIITASGAQTYNPASNQSSDTGTAVVGLAPSAGAASFSGWGIPL